MLNDKGFDLWADNYDKTVGISDEDGTYPFAGYKEVLNTIYNRILSAQAKTVLDIGFGTGTLAFRLYERGLSVFGQDFSEKMIGAAQRKMPEATFIQGDFSEGLAEPLLQKKYDAITATYSLHHLTDEKKIELIRLLRSLLNEGGCLYIGDVAFQTREELNSCAASVGDEWDDEELYFVFDELSVFFPDMKFEPISHCAGLLILH